MTRDHRNNFDLIRLAAALLVVYGHQLQLYGLPMPMPLGVPVSKTGVDLFFCVSGYLVTDSWEREPRLRGFLRKRGLRIFPGLAAAVAATVLGLGPCLTALPASSYFAEPETWRYWSNIGLYLRNDLPGVFEGGGERAVNGSLWSLFPEFCCYLSVPAFALAPRRLRPAALAGAACAAGCAGLALIAHPPIPAWRVYHADPGLCLLEACFFLSGGCWRLLDRGGGVPYRADVAILACLVRAGLAGRWPSFGLAFDWIALPYLAICFGRMALPAFARIGRWGDCSYGLYLSAFPIQQALMRAGAPHALPLAAGLAGAYGMLSWHLVEKRALRLRIRWPILMSPVA